MHEAAPKRANNSSSLNKNFRSCLNLSSRRQFSPAMNDARKRLNQAHVAHVKVLRHKIQRFFRHNSVFSESAVAEDAESVVEATFFAKMRIRVSTMIAAVTTLVRIDRDFVADFDRSDVIADSSDDSASFVAGDEDVADV